MAEFFACWRQTWTPSRWWSALLQPLLPCQVSCSRLVSSLLGQDFMRAAYTGGLGIATGSAIGHAPPALLASLDVGHPTLQSSCFSS